VFSYRERAHQEIGQSEVRYGHISPNTWIIDSPQALEIAEGYGGAIFLDKYPGCKLQISGFDSNNGWWVVYAMGEPDAGGEVWIARFAIEIDPYNGSTRIVEDTDGVSGEVVILGE
jgi:hypothetical protein